MSSLINTLTASITAVCPIDGLSIGNVNDKKTWRIDFSPNATPDQQTAALQIINDFIIDKFMLDDARTSAADDIDQAAGMARGRYITIAPCQSATYLLKADDAVAYRAAGYPDQNIASYPFINAKALSQTDQPGPADYKAAADLILLRRDQWIALGAEIERIREKGKGAVMAALKSQDIDLAKNQALKDLGLV